jgi:GNAT superfamily N-acetyltransferase
MSHPTSTTSLLRDETDLARLRLFLKGLSNKPDMNNFEEHMAMRSIRAVTRLWQRGGQLTAFAYVDAYNNLHFEIHPDHRSGTLETDIVEWGLACIRQRNAETGASSTLDASCSASDEDRLAFLERFGFVREPVRSLKYSRPLEVPIEAVPFPPGFSVRCAAGESEVESLVALHRAAFGTENMTVEERLAIMRAPNYIPELDLMAVAPDGELSAFCICELEGEGESKIGFTDPIGTHPRHWRLGLGRAILSAGLRALKERGALRAELGTSSENLSMQRLAERMGFVCVSENLWFSKKVP